MYNVAEVYGYQLDLNRIEMEYVEQVAIRVLKPTQNKMIRSFEECFYKVTYAMRILKDPAEMALLLSEQIEEIEELKGSIDGTFFWRTKEIKKQTKHIKLIEEKRGEIYGKHIQDIQKDL